MSKQAKPGKGVYRSAKRPNPVKAKGLAKEIEYRKHFRKSFFDNSGLITGLCRNRQVTVKLSELTDDQLNKIVVRSGICKATIIALLVESWMLKSGAMGAGHLSEPRSNARMERLLKAIEP